MSVDYPGKCPKCGWFCSGIRMTTSHFGECIGTVTGNCKQHGKVDLTDQEWSWEDFDTEVKEAVK